jgi:hypothetical protein
MRHSLAVILLLAVGSANAALVEFNSGDFYGTSAGGGVGTGRGISFQADTTFTIDSIGIFTDLNSGSYDAVIFSSTDGHQANSVLGTSTELLSGVGNDWNDISIDYTFNANDYYVILWRPTDGNGTWTNSIDYYYDSGLPATAGPATLIDGVEGYDADSFINTLHPNMRVNIIPIPAAVWLFGSGLGVLGWMRRRQTA